MYLEGLGGPRRLRADFSSFSAVPAAASHAIKLNVTFLVAAGCDRRMTASQAACISVPNPDPKR
jgi:hypothetical protein